VVSRASDKCGLACLSVPSGSHALPCVSLSHEREDHCEVFALSVRSSDYYSPVGSFTILTSAVLHFRWVRSPGDCCCFPTVVRFPVVLVSCCELVSGSLCTSSLLRGVLCVFVVCPLGVIG